MSCGRRISGLGKAAATTTKGDDYQPKADLVHDEYPSATMRGPAVDYAIGHRTPENLPEAEYGKRRQLFHLGPLGTVVPNIERRRCILKPGTQ